MAGLRHHGIGFEHGLSDVAGGRPATDVIDLPAFIWVPVTSRRRPCSERREQIGPISGCTRLQPWRREMVQRVMHGTDAVDGARSSGSFGGDFVVRRGARWRLTRRPCGAASSSAIIGASREVASRFLRQCN